MLLGCTGWLMADIPDPTIRLSIPGTGTFPLCTVGAAGESCTTTLVDGHPDTTIGDNGFGSFAVKNVDQNGLTVDSIDFFFQTNNLDQAFSASTDDFSTVNIIRHFACDGEFCGGTLEVDFSGMLAKSDTNVGGSFSLAGIACFEGCPTAVGFIPHSNITVVSEYNVVPDPTQCCDGIQPGEEAGLAITSDVPEPSSFVLLLGVGGLLAIKRKFKFHRT
jgi:hypothetical protein